MAPKPKAGGAKKRAGKAAVSKAKEAPQRERFITAARASGVTTDGFEKLFNRIVRPNRGGS